MHRPSLGMRSALTAGPGATTTITAGGLYQLWLVAINSKGRSAAGPVRNWTAV